MSYFYELLFEKVNIKKITKEMFKHYGINIAIESINYDRKSINKHYGGINIAIESINYDRKSINKHYGINIAIESINYDRISIK